MQIDNGQAVPSGSFSAWSFPGVFIVIGIAIVLFGVRNAERAYASNFWLQADGIVRSSKVRQRSTNKNGVTYLADVSYDYVVSGTRYSSSQISFSQFGLNSSGHATFVISHYPKGKKIRVFYEPNHPALSVLEEGLSTSNLFIPLGGALFVVAGIFLGPTRKRKPTTIDHPAILP